MDRRPHPLTVTELIHDFRAWAEGYYRSLEGEPTGEIHAIRDALRPLASLFGRTLAAEFGPRKLVALRDAMIEKDLSRGLINRRVNIVKRLFKWAAERELAPASVHHGLQAVSGLRPGRSRAREAPPVEPVAESDVRAVLPHVPPPVRAMIEIQLLTGMRPGEAVILRPCDVDRARSPWIYSPSRHKTRHLGHARRIPLGPRAQSILSPFLEGRAPDAFAFSPREARARETPGRFDYERAPRERYDVDSYRRAISLGAKRAGVPHWHPNRLRHTAATRLRERYGIEAAAAILGHRIVETTQIYAETDAALAARIMGEIG